jgi:putative transposase
MSLYRRSKAQGAAFFFTVTLADRQTSLLIDHIDVLRQAYQRVARDYPFQTMAICVLPNHLHALWQLPPNDNAYSLRWSLIKRYFSRELPANEQRSLSKIAKREKGIWQRRYWEHQIRDDDDMQNHINYIHFNPVKHGLVTNAADWFYSSYSKTLNP